MSGLLEILKRQWDCRDVRGEAEKLDGPPDRVNRHVAISPGKVKGAVVRPAANPGPAAQRAGS